MRRLKQIVIAVLVLISGLWLYDFFRKEPTPKDAQAPLTESEHARIVIEDNRVTAVTHERTETAYVPSSGKSVITVKEDGAVNVVTKNKGLSSELGGGVFYADELRLGLDLQVFYWARLGGHVGFGFGRAPIVCPFVAVSYRLDRIRLANSSLMVGITVEKSPLVGIRWEF